MDDSTKKLPTEESAGGPLSPMADKSVESESPSVADNHTEDDNKTFDSTDDTVKLNNMAVHNAEKLEAEAENILTQVATSTDPDEFNIYSGLSREDYPVPKWVEKFDKWRRKTMSDFLFLLWLAIIVGAGAGFLAFIFNRLISNLSDIFLSHIKTDSLNWWLIPMPVIGILLAGIFTRYIVKTNLTHGVSQLMHDIYKGEYKLRGSLIFSPIFGSTITLGFGGSAGSEGPIAYAGAALGSNVGRILGLSAPKLKFLIGCGAAAGIAGIFQSPIGGLLFTLEFLRMELMSLSAVAIVVSCVVAYGVVFLCNGCLPIDTFTPAAPLEPHHYWAVIALGLFCGVYSLYYTSAINITDSWFSRLKNPWLRNMTGGLFVGICLFLFPSLFGVGYPVMSDTIHEHYTDLMGGNILHGFHMGKWTMIIVALCILLIKCWACGTTNASGGVSSDFAPTLFAGGIAGFLFATFSNEILGCHLPVGLFTFIGMGGVMAGCIEAPLMTIFIVLNMGMGFGFALPISVAVLFSYVTVRLASQLRGYDSKMVRHLHWFHHNDTDVAPQASPETVPYNPKDTAPAIDNDTPDSNASSQS